MENSRINVKGMWVFGVAVLLTGTIVSCRETPEDPSEKADVLGFQKMDSLTLQLEQIKVLFPTVEQWEERDAIQYRKDSAIVFDRSSEMLLEKTFGLNIEATTEVLVEMQYETKLSIITNDGEIVLNRLKNYVSPWRKLNQDANNRYIKTAFTQDEIRMFPETPIDKILDHLFWETRTTQSEFDWTKYLKQAKSIQEFPFKISISKITLRFRGNYISGDPFVKYVIFYVGN